MQRFLADFAVPFAIVFVLQTLLCLSDGSVSLLCVAEGFFAALSMATFYAGFLASERISKQRLIDGAEKRKSVLWIFPAYCLLIFLALAASCILGDIHHQHCVIGGACDWDWECLTVPAAFAAVFALVVGLQFFRSTGD